MWIFRGPLLLLKPPVAERHSQQNEAQNEHGPSEPPRHKWFDGETIPRRREQDTTENGAKCKRSEHRRLP